MRKRTSEREPKCTPRWREGIDSWDKALPAIPWHAYVPEAPRSYRSLCGRHRLLIGERNVISRPAIELRCRACDVAEQKLFMVWEPLEASPPPRPPAKKGGVVA